MLSRCLDRPVTRRIGREHRCVPEALQHRAQLRCASSKTHLTRCAASHLLQDTSSGSALDTESEKQTSVPRLYKQTAESWQKVLIVVEGLHDLRAVSRAVPAQAGLNVAQH